MAISTGDFQPSLPSMFDPVSWFCFPGNHTWQWEIHGKSPWIGWENLIGSWKMGEFPPRKNGQLGGWDDSPWFNTRSHQLSVGWRARHSNLASNMFSEWILFSKPHIELTWSCRCLACWLGTLLLFLHTIICIPIFDQVLVTSWHSS